MWRGGWVPCQGIKCIKCNLPLCPEVGRAPCQGIKCNLPLCPEVGWAPCQGIKCNLPLCPEVGWAPCRDALLWEATSTTRTYVSQPSARVRRRVGLSYAQPEKRIEQFTWAFVEDISATNVKFAAGTRLGTTCCDMLGVSIRINPVLWEVIQGDFLSEHPL